jgi:hypothetical protein
MNAKQIQEESDENQPATLKQLDRQRLRNSHTCLQGCVKESKNRLHAISKKESTSLAAQTARITLILQQVTITCNGH